MQLGPTLDRRSLNRALLARQLLLERVNRSPGDVVEHLVGLQAQEPIDPYVALWSRIEGFDPMTLSDMLEDRRVVRAQLLRATIHLVTDRDLLAMRPVLRPVLDRMLASGSPFGRSLVRAGVDQDAVAEAGRRLLEEQPRTRAELRELLAPQFPGADSAALAQAVTFLVPVVQIPPRALWRRSGLARWATIESWLGRSPAEDASPEGLVLRYVAAFGPAGAADVRAWSGLTGAAEILDRLRPRLRPFRDEQGRELLDLPDAPRPDPDTPAPIRFLPVYDNVTLSHADRGRIVEKPHRRTVLDLDMINFGSVLADGFGKAIWRVARDRGPDAATLDIALLEDRPAAEIDQIGVEGERLLAFLEPSRNRREVQFRRLSTA